MTMLNFRRVTTQNRFIPQIDGLRFVAISSVVLFHLYASLNHGGAVQNPAFDAANVGVLSKRGVELFFVISGFILGVPFASSYLRGAPKINLKQYFLRRLTRLEPPYILSLLVWAGILFVVARQSGHEILPHLLASMGYLHNLIYNSDSTINVVAWSLEVEVQFYVLVPLLAGIFGVADTRIRRGLIVLLMIVSALLGGQLLHTRLQTSVLYFLPFFMAGFLLCDLYVTRRDWRSSWVWDLVALCGWPLVWYLSPGWNHILLPFIIVMLYLAAFRGRICSTLFSYPIITDIGGMCYSLYLFHFLIISSVGRVSKPVHIGHNFWVYYSLQAVLVLPVVLMLCGIFFLLVERPCMDRDWPRKLWNHWFVSPSAPVASAMRKGYSGPPAVLP
jgi:peptidoglycan/LPS O-acetylase OafA/YrhL